MSSAGELIELIGDLPPGSVLELPLHRWEEVLSQLQMLSRRKVAPIKASEFSIGDVLVRPRERRGKTVEEWRKILEVNQTLRSHEVEMILEDWEESLKNSPSST